MLAPLLSPSPFLLRRDTYCRPAPVGNTSCHCLFAFETSAVCAHHTLSPAPPPRDVCFDLALLFACTPAIAMPLSSLLLSSCRRRRHLSGGCGRPGFLTEAPLHGAARAVVRPRLLLHMCHDLVRYYCCTSVPQATGVFTNATSAS